MPTAATYRYSATPSYATRGNLQYSSGSNLDICYPWQRMHYAVAGNIRYLYHQWQPDTPHRSMPSVATCAMPSATARYSIDGNLTIPGSFIDAISGNLYIHAVSGNHQAPIPTAAAYRYP